MAAKHGVVIGLVGAAFAACSGGAVRTTATPAHTAGSASTANARNNVSAAPSAVTPVVTFVRCEQYARSTPDVSTKPRPSKPVVRTGVVGTLRARRSAGGFGGVGLRRAPPRYGMSRATIQRVIRSKIGQVRQCYEKQLLVTPGLSGRVTTFITISAHGVVLRSEAKGLHPAVDSCIASVMHSLTFPKPAGGGVVRVRYPFVFTNVGRAKSKTGPKAAAPGGSTRKSTSAAATGGGPSGTARAPVGSPFGDAVVVRTPVTKPHLHKLPWSSCRIQRTPSVLASLSPKIKSCYAAALSRNTTLAGRLYVQYATTKDGTHVDQAEVSGVADSELRACVKGLVNGMAMPTTPAAPTPHTGACSVSLRPGESTGPGTTRIHITKTSVTVGTSTLAPTRRLTLGRYSAAVVKTLVHGLTTRTTLRNGAHVALQVDPGVDVKAVNLVILALRNHGEHPLRLAVGFSAAAEPTAYVDVAGAGGICRGGNWQADVVVGVKGLRVFSAPAGVVSTSTSALRKPGAFTAAVAGLAKQSHTRAVVRVDHGMTYRTLAQTLAAVRKAGVKNISYMPPAAP